MPVREQCKIARIAGFTVALANFDICEVNNDEKIDDNIQILKFEAEG